MIELDEKGQIPKATSVRVYGVAGYSGNRTFQGLNIWTNDSPRSQADIEAYPSFKGWASPRLFFDQLNKVPGYPANPGEFRVGLLAETYPGRGPEVAVQQYSGGYTENLDTEPRFLGWISPILTFHVPAPVPQVMVRYKAPYRSGTLEGIFFCRQQELREAFGRKANFGRPFGLDHDIEVVLEPAHFLCLAVGQSEIEQFQASSSRTTLSGFNPLVHLVEEAQA